ncbi:PoNe immunity protein domain-containing protein [Comamonas sp. J-3]|uniref:PoNe immunity protein domain-containing protein n=1 Tax=Comamonas trifloxystrobinivorans TaxID=3350256 RepID=UPI00372A0B8A
MLRTAFSHHGDLAAACAAAAQIPLASLQPRRKLNLAGKRAEWKALLGELRRFASSYRYREATSLAAHAALENYWHWQQSGQTACQLLVCGIDLGLSGEQLRPLYLQTVALWRDAAAVADHARASMREATGADFGVGAPLATRTQDYRFAIVLLTLASLLNATDEVPAIVQEVLAFETDQLLDYLSAGGLELQQVSEELWHKRPFGALRPFFEQLQAEPEPLHAYLQNQYRDLSAVSPKQQKKGGPWSGPHYWALEVGALAVLYGWDDSALRSSPHYPADLVDFARRAEPA